MKDKLVSAYMATAKVFAELSHARRLHVGAIIVKNNRIISIGYNGMPAGWDNNCEDVEWMPSEGLVGLSVQEILDRWPLEGELVDEDGNGMPWRYRLITKPEVLHAETNAIAKLAMSNESGENSDMFVTHAPCMECAKLIFQSGIKRIFYSENYRDESGVDFLTKSGVNVVHLENQGNQ
jgi:dCMP deaminase